MIFISKFRSNDLNSSKGKQIEFNPTICKDFFGFTEPNVYTEFECRSMTNSNIVQNIKVSFTLSPARSDYKIYNNSDGSNLKDFFLDTLGLTEDNSNDYFAIKKKSNGKYVLFYIPDSELIRDLFAFTKSDIITINNPELLGELNNITPRQVIYYGAPGTGKSYKIKGLVNEGNHVRTTFHPDSDYASFVGAYKPTMIEVSSRDMAGHVILDKGKEVQEKKIVYEFVAQSFLQAYTEAWKRSVGIMTDKEGINAQMHEGMDDKYYLVIEEINRGNCAQIFGDLFQLLDRDDNGESSYAIRPDQDMKRYLTQQFEGLEGLPEAIRRGEEMKLPSNLYIFATMNTSDQSLFPIDSAFKRRWDWEYVPIKDEKKGYYIKVGDTAYLWSDFLDKINETILRVTQSDDKQMGYWFVHLPEGQKEVSTDKFVGKVLFYLWNDVFKDFGDGENTIFIGEKEDGSKYELRFKSFFGDERDERIRDLMRYNKVEPMEDSAEIYDEEDSSDDNNFSSSDIKEWRTKFWTKLHNEYAIRGFDFTGKLNDRAYYQMPSGVPYLNFINSVKKQKGSCWVGLYMEVERAEKIYKQLSKFKSEINLPFKLEWIPNTDEHRYASIRAITDGYDFDNTEDCATAVEWIADCGTQIFEAFKPYLSKIK